MQRGFQPNSESDLALIGCAYRLNSGPRSVTLAGHSAWATQACSVLAGVSVPQSSVPGESMAQVKKPEIRNAILSAADRLFSERGYHNTTLAQIAVKANVSTANLYVYFQSKLDILYSIYDPWLRQRVSQLEGEVKRLRTPQQRVFKLLHALWCEIPSEKNGFANNFMQAITTSDPKEGYRPELLKWFEERIAAILGESLPPERRALIAQARFTHLLAMAFDGFVIGNHLHPDLECDEKTITLMASLLIGSLDAGASEKPDARRPKRPVRVRVDKPISLVRR
ncbi:MAG TPA: TetR/AcrR family transcriptional regulator [Alphaproteobacteria bacterium]|nr:TetR/AcrR family transcriptional regulator [Alphaproteobacteria bacterium]